MTLIYGFSSEKHKKAFLATDNFAEGSGQICDKIFFLEGRFAIAVVGVDQVVPPLNAMAAVELKRDREVIDSIEVLGEHVIRYTNVWMKLRYPQFAALYDYERISQRHWDLLHKSEVSLIVMDSRDLKLYKVDLGCIFPPSNIKEKAEIQELPTEQWLRFGIAGREWGETDTLTEKDIENPVPRFHLEVGKAQLELRYGGCPGAYLIVAGDEVDFKSTFSSPTEYLQQWANQGPCDIHIHVLGEGEPEEKP